MSDSINNPRNGCALHGGIQTVAEIGGAVPVIHANAGCGVINYLANKASGQSGAYYSGLNIPGTIAQERHVVFGGASRLREQIKNTIKVVDGELYVILNSCVSAMVGDDVDAMTREIVEQGEPVVDTLSAGFSGSSHYGYEHVIADILKSIDKVKNVENDKQQNLINIFGIIPEKDPYWNGNLQEIKRIFSEIGIEANVFFGPVEGVKELVKASKAALSIVFSRWGELPAKVLEEKYQIPYIIENSLPATSLRLEKLILKIKEFVEVEESKVEVYLETQRRKETYFKQHILKNLVEDNLISDVVIVADEADAIRYANIVNDWLGADIKAIVLTDALKKDADHQTDNSEELEKLTANVYISNDSKAIADIVIKNRPEVLIGSSLEREVAENLQIPLLEVSYPIYQKAIFNKSFAGIDGAVAFAEDFISEVKAVQREKKDSLVKVVNA